jgi:membrane-associated protease RseP (regulator of RpoE activity)
MGSSIGGANSLTAFTFGIVNPNKAAVALSVGWYLTGGDPNYGAAGQNSALWAQAVVLQADPAGGSVRYRYDGGAAAGATLAAGHILTGGDSARIEGFQNLKQLVIASNQVTAGIVTITAERAQ